MMFTCFTKEKYCTGCSAVRLAHLLWEQGVVGSNPATPTKKELIGFPVSSFLFYETENNIVFKERLFPD